MDRLKLFERALLGKQIAGNSLLVILDTIYLITGVFFGLMDFRTLIQFLLFANMFATCVLYHNLIVSRGDSKLELNTWKTVYYPTTRYRYLLHKYAKTLIFLSIQLLLTIVCLGLGNLGCMGKMEASRVIGSLLTVFISILLTSGTTILVMHIMPLGIYLSMALYIPFIFAIDIFEKLLKGKTYLINNVPLTVTAIILITVILWIIILWIAGKVYETINY